MASSIITFLHSAMYDLASLQDKCPDDLKQSEFVILRHRLRNLKTFLLCTRKLGRDVHLQGDETSDNKDRSLASLLVRIKEAVSRNAQKIHTYRLSLEIGFCMDVIDEVDKFQADIESFDEVINEWYITFSDYSWQSTSPAEVLDIIDSVQDNLAEFLIMPIHNDFVVNQIEDLGEKIKLLRSFIPFAVLAVLTSAEHRQLGDLLAHIEAVVTETAHLTAQHTLTKSYLFEMVFGEKWWKGMPEEISLLLQRIKPIDRRVCEIYIQALVSLKLSKQLDIGNLGLNDNTGIIMMDFIDFLLFVLWELLQLDVGLAVSWKDQMQELAEGLRYLRTSLKNQQNKFNESIREPTRVLICDAGIIIFSLYQNDVKVDHELTNLLGKIKLLREEVDEKVPETSTFNLPKTNQLGFIDFLLENLMELINDEAYSFSWSQVQAIHGELVCLRSFLGEIVEFHDEQEQLRVLWDRIMEIACRVELAIEQLVLGHAGDSLSAPFDSIINDISIFKADFSKILPGIKKDIKVQDVVWTSSHVQPQGHSLIADEVVGLEFEVAPIKGRLTRGSKQLRVVSIVGMPGLGKTTIATKLYNDFTVKHHFHVHAWSTLSQEFNKKKVCLELLNGIVPNKHFAMDEVDLAEELRRRLKGRRYLIVLDDVWDIQAWNSLAGSLPNDSNGSRIILTSRLREVAPAALLDAEPHFLRQLTIDESWELLQKKLFHGISCPPELHELGIKIAEKCKGLPLTVVTIAGLLANTRLEVWHGVLESLSSGIVSTTEQCMNTLELSYKHLPDYLKPCFLYFGAFPEDTVISVRSLILLWISEGFVRKSEFKSLEEVATDYLMDLIGRSLVMVFWKRSIGGVKACRVHDLLHDFCLTKAKEENLFLLLRGYDELSAFHKPCRRLCIYSTQKHLKESKLFSPRVHSLLFFDQTEWYEQTSLDISFILRSFQLLRVLNIRQINLGPVFPDEIELLVQLRYLSVHGEMDAIPSLLGNLSKLETLIVFSSRKVSLPNTLWKLQRLRHLYIRVDPFGFGFSLPTENLDNTPRLHELVSFSGAIISSWKLMESQLKKFPNMRKLKCKLFEYDDVDPEICVEIMVPESLSRLESLNLSLFDENRKHIDFEFHLPANLKKLTLSLFRLPWAKASVIGKLPNLEVLKLLTDAFSGESWDMEEGEFANLRFLKLESLDIVRWTACSDDDQFPNLQKLVLNYCPKLEEIPCCLENISTLEVIEVSSCWEGISSLVEQIQEVQTDMGNSALKISISHVSKSS
ncbi:OLC1v1023720C1 [Oldenlandia corymbosa var. corymbosa]|uniref:OLC1v1023720C1 n=1 Tax=Oldenlandia corymbosa var. corymbosa TaxID=529605 RepID=A0AAV1C3G0_OLDCO|nr:OLC1v1023720C1 [Oldenlandia corymbosa var. corymbosa]